MHLTIFNGSPRRKRSNSSILTDWFVEGFIEDSSNKVQVLYLAGTLDFLKHLEAFAYSENIIIIFPLYTDSMPAIVKKFLENVFTYPGLAGKHVGFIVQSGFPESIHSSFVKRYLDKFAERMHWKYKGTVVKGGVEGIQIMPPALTGKLHRRFHRLGKYYADNRIFDPKVVNDLAKPYRLSPGKHFMFRLIRAVGFSNYYLNKKLK